MRFLHYHVDHIVRCVTSAGLTVTKCDRTGMTPHAGVDETAISEMLGATEKLWGALLPYFLWVSNSPKKNALTLKESVGLVEAASESHEFLLVGYEDGGIISVSNTKLPFQGEAQAAEWWKP